jgi:hypothetical protein
MVAVELQFVVKNFHESRNVTCSFCIEKFMFWTGNCRREYQKYEVKKLSWAGRRARMWF